MNNSDFTTRFEKYRLSRLRDFGQSYDEFLRITDHDELLIIILRGHLYIEREINNLLEKIFIDESYKNSLFSQKVDLCKSLDLIRSERIPSLKKLNKQRNGYAHDLDFHLTTKDYEDLISTLSLEAKKQFELELDEFYQKNSVVERSLRDNYRVLLAAIWAELKTENIFFIYNFQLRSRQVIDKEENLIKLANEKNFNIRE